MITIILILALPFLIVCLTLYMSGCTLYSITETTLFKTYCIIEITLFKILEFVAGVIVTLLAIAITIHFFVDLSFKSVKRLLIKDNS